jgi:hypothetical protein
MKFIKLLHIILGIIPFLWLISFLVILTIGTIHFGYIPKAGNPVDPYALGLDSINRFEVGLVLLSFIAFFLYIPLTILLYILSKQKANPNNLSLILFTIGVGGFLIFRYIFTDVFLWVAD